MKYRGKDHTGINYGMLTAIKFVGYGKSKKIMWEFKCACGTVCIKRVENITNGHILSCGCLQKLRTTKHGMHKTPEYAAYLNMKSRINNPGSRHSCYKGLTISKDWLDSFDNFYRDMGDRLSSKHSVDRIDNSKGYSAENCKWSDKKEQARNRSTTRFFEYKGKMVTTTELSKISGISGTIILTRITKLGWSIDEAINTPKIERGQKRDPKYRF